MALGEDDTCIVLHPKSRWRAGSIDDLVTGMESALSDIPGIDFEFTAPMRMRLGEVISGVKTDLGVKLVGDSLPVLQAVTEEVSVHGRPASEVLAAGARDPPQPERRGGNDRRFGVAILNGLVLVTTVNHLAKEAPRVVDECRSGGAAPPGRRVPA